MWYGIGWPCGTRRASNPSSCAAPGSGCTTHSQGKTVYRFQGGTMRETLAGSVCQVRNGAERCAFVGADSYSLCRQLLCRQLLAMCICWCRQLLSLSQDPPSFFLFLNSSHRSCKSMRIRILSYVDAHTHLVLRFSTSASHSHFWESLTPQV